METLIQKLKTEDEKYLRISRNFKVLFWIMIIFYSGFFIFNPDKQLSILDRLGGACYVLTFTVFLLIYRSYYKELKSVDYNLPTTEMLKNVIKRYRLFQPRTAASIIPIILLDGGLTLNFIDHFTDFEMIYRILIVQAFYIPVMAIAFLIGVRFWYKKHKPLRDKASELLKDFEP